MQAYLSKAPQPHTHGPGYGEDIKGIVPFTLPSQGGDYRSPDSVKSTQSLKGGGTDSMGSWARPPQPHPARPSPFVRTTSSAGQGPGEFSQALLLIRLIFHEYFRH